MSGEKSREIVGKWFSAGVSSLAGQAMVTEDFKWIGPSSMAFMFGTPEKYAAVMARLKRLRAGEPI